METHTYAHALFPVFRSLDSPLKYSEACCPSVPRHAIGGVGLTRIGRVQITITVAFGTSTNFDNRC